MNQPCLVGLGHDIAEAGMGTDGHGTARLGKAWQGGAMLGIASRGSARRGLLLNDHGLGDAYLCVDCKIDTCYVNEYYMVHDSLWPLEVDGMLCVGCLEARIGRELVPTDFLDISANYIGEFSPRLCDRIGLPRDSTFFDFL